MATIYESELLISKLDEEFAALKTYVKSAVRHDEIHVVEGTVFRKLLQMG